MRARSWSHIQQVNGLTLFQSWRVMQGHCLLFSVWFRARRIFIAMFSWRAAHIWNLGYKIWRRECSFDALQRQPPYVQCENENGQVCVNFTSFIHHWFSCLFKHLVRLRSCQTCIAWCRLARLVTAPTSCRAYHAYTQLVNSLRTMSILLFYQLHEKDTEQQEFSMSPCMLICAITAATQHADQQIKGASS